MGRLNARKRHLVTIREKARAALTVTEEECEMHSNAEPLTLRAPLPLYVEREPEPQRNKCKARAAWRFVVDNFHRFPMSAEEGDASRPTKDYGGLRAIMKFPEKPLTRTRSYGLVFQGAKSYAKRGISKHTLPKSARKLSDLMGAVIKSLMDTPTMVCIDSRVGAFEGVTSGWHTDANPRGAHPNAMRPIDKGGGVVVYRGCPFRCTLVLFRGTPIIPLDLNPMDFRYMVWRTSKATIETKDAACFWSEVVHASGGPVVLGYIGGSVLSMSKGHPLLCPLDYQDIRSTSKELVPLTLSNALISATLHPFTPPSTLWELVGADTNKWSVFYGWRDPHCTIGDPWVRRLHVISCPLRQNGSGQNRRAPPQAPKPIKVDPELQRILALKPGWMIDVIGRSGPGQVVNVEPALEAHDVKVKVLYEAENGAYAVVSERLAGKVWTELDEFF